tara:strand:+ start:463 stop:744 length:282 start_codon:yes stop_codon:yes gene_type:complete
MNNLSTIIKLYVGSKVDFDKDVSLQDDGQGAYIKTWNINTKTKPTQEQLNALKTQAQTIVDSYASKKATDKASANAKLKALGLTDDEIKAIKS